MIELYLAILLFGLGSYFNQKNTYQKNSIGKINPIPGVDIDQVESEQLAVKTEPVSDTIKRLEGEYATQLDKDCKTIENRDFGSLMDAKSKELYRMRKLNETGKKGEIDEEVSDGILKYTPKTKDTVFSSLTGTEMNLGEFTNSKIIAKDGTSGNENINNSWAVPYFGSVAKQPMNVESFQNRLETFTGTSQFNFHKRETSNFFVPVQNNGNVNGSPNRTNQIRERMVQSNNRQNELPFEQQRVAPGLGQNYGNQGIGGHHQFEVDEIARPRNIDQLRSLSNPRVTYRRPIISGKGIDQRSASPNVVRNRVTKTFALGNDRRFTTTGAFTREASRPTTIVPDTNRMVSRSFTGAAAPVNSKRTYTKPTVQDSMRNIYTSTGISNAYSSNSWDARRSNSDYGRSSFKAIPNERDVTQKRTHMTNLISMIKSIIAPLQDKMKASKKEFVVGNPNPEGYFAADMPKKQTTYDPNDVAKTTIKETTLEYDHDGHIKGPEKLTVHDPNDVARTTIKETTIEYDHDGHIKGPEKQTVYDPNDIARTTIKETTIHRKDYSIITGAQKVTVYDPNDVAKTTIKETTIHNTHNGNLREQVPSRPTNNNIQAPKTTMKETTIDNKHINNVAYVRGDGKGYLSNVFFAPATLKQLTSDNEYEGNVYSSQYSSGGYLSNEFYAPATIKQFTSDFEYVGSAGTAGAKASTSYNSAYNAITNSLREKISRGRSPTQTGAKQFNGGSDSVNVLNKRQTLNIDASKQLKISRVAQVNRDASEENITNYRTPLTNVAQVERFNPSQLNQLRRNPFALSLNRRFGANRGTSGYSSGSGSESE